MAQSDRLAGQVVDQGVVGALNMFCTQTIRTSRRASAFARARVRIERGVIGGARNLSPGADCVRGFAAPVFRSRPARPIIEPRWQGFPGLPLLSAAPALVLVTALLAQRSTHNTYSSRALATIATCFL